MNPIQFYEFGKGRKVSDPDAQAFITAAGIMYSTQQQAINDLVIGLKADGTWSKMKAIYPFVGGTAFTHKWNLKDPRDLDAAYRLIFTISSGTLTHDANGMTPSVNSVAYGNSFVTPSTMLTDISTHISIYSRTASTSVNIDIGSAQGTTQRLMFQVQHTDNRMIADLYSAGSDGRSAAIVTNSQGLFLANRTAINVLNTWRNSTKINTNSNTSTSLQPAIPIYIGATNGFPNSPGRNYAFATIGDGLTDTDVANLYTRVQAFQTTIGRQV